MRRFIHAFTHRDSDTTLRNPANPNRYSSDRDGRASHLDPTGIPGDHRS